MDNGPRRDPLTAAMAEVRGGRPDRAIALLMREANREKTKVKLATTDNHDPNNLELLPVVLRELIARSQTLHAKVRRLDNTIHNISAEQAPSINPVEHQLGLLKAAFGVEKV